MKRSSVFSAWTSVALLMVGFATGKAMAQAGDVVVHATTVDVTHFPGTEPVDQIDMTATFTNNEFVEMKHCEAADSLILHGVKVTVQQGLCNAPTRKNNVTIPFFTPLVPGSNVADYNGFSKERASVDAVLRTLKRLPGTCSSYSLESTQSTSISPP